jgi:acid stress-induced BolA-like protein IbaG/YrbA
MSSIHDAIREAIAAQVADARIDVSGEGGHFQIAVVSPVFEGLGTLERHRMVLGAIKDLMAGDNAPVHAIDSLKTSTS